MSTWRRKAIEAVPELREAVRQWRGITAHRADAQTLAALEAACQGRIRHARNS
ncbi:hypothetical protein [Bordetella genomosp. 13]|uniref:hypothetical protein n=1 Tax=Bordetella genomosp. 13 TaxID=463040 RepID=UPI0016433F84|nr:hypothetical protein [Bordetella genomosp. 13]